MPHHSDLCHTQARTGILIATQFLKVGKIKFIRSNHAKNLTLHLDPYKQL